MELKYTGIILGKYDVGETDRMYIIYTKEAGKIRVLGKGVRRPNAKLAGHLEPVTLAEIFVARSRGVGKITGSIVLNNFARIKNNFNLLQKVFFALKIFEKLISDEEKDENIFVLVNNFLESLEKSWVNEEKIQLLALGFLFKLFSEAGYRLEMEKCVACGKKLKSGENYFSAEKGGVVCAICVKKERARVKIKDESIKLIRIFGKNKIENLAKLKVLPGDIKNLKTVIQEVLNWV